MSTGAKSKFCKRKHRSQQYKDYASTSTSLLGQRTLQFQKLFTFLCQDRKNLSGMEGWRSGIISVITQHKLQAL